MNHDAGCTCDRCWSATLRGAIASGTRALCERAIANHFAPAPRAPSRPAAPRRPPIKRLRNPEPPLVVAALVPTVADVAPKKRRGRPPKIRPAAIDHSPPRASTFPHLVDDQLDLPTIAAPAIAAPEPAIAIEPEIARLAPSPVRPHGTGTPCRVCGVDDGADRAQRDLHLRCVEAAVPRKKPAARTHAARPTSAPPRGRLAVIARLAAKHTRKAERMAARRDRERLDPDRVDEDDEEEALPSLRDLTHG